MQKTLFSALLFLLSASTLFAQSALASAEAAFCYYELYTPEHFDRPVITKTFALDLTKPEFTSTSDPALKRIIRLQTQPATLDGKNYTHYAFSMTYDGAHTGAIIPKTPGMHVMQIGRDGSDLLGAYLFCDIRISANAESTPFAPVPEYGDVVCANLNEIHKQRQILIKHKTHRRYTAELSYQDSTGKFATRSLGDLELYLFNQKTLTFAGPGVVVETGLLQRHGPAWDARVSSNNPYYSSNDWVCKAY
jgi:hypothetical protein